MIYSFRNTGGSQWNIVTYFVRNLYKGRQVQEAQASRLEQGGATMGKEKIVNRQNVMQVVEELLDFPFWPEGLESMMPYRVQTDDTDGNPAYGWLSVVIGPDGDAHLSVTATDLLPDEIRFRTFAGGGSHLRVRNASLLLAVAIKKDMDGEGNPGWDDYAIEDDEDDE